jgi:vesicle coat complex subunit
VVEEDFASRLKRVHQLSGFADPVYCEAYLTVHEYDIVLEILVINRTDATLTNVAVELATMGDLRLVERPQSFTLGPQDSKTLRANIKVGSHVSRVPPPPPPPHTHTHSLVSPHLSSAWVGNGWLLSPVSSPIHPRACTHAGPPPSPSLSVHANNQRFQVSSTENGEIFGTITFDAASSIDKSVVNLNGIKIDILDYIQPATCSDPAFRTMWSDFEWENKVAVNTTMTYVLHHVATGDPRVVSSSVGCALGRARL